MGGINKQRQNFTRLLILCHVMARYRQFFFRECSCTINRHNGVKNTVWCQGLPSVTNMYGMKLNHTPLSNVTHITSCIERIDKVNKSHHIFEFVNYIMFPNEIDISKQYELGIDYVHESLNESTQLFQKANMN